MNDYDPEKTYRDGSAYYTMAALKRRGWTEWAVGRFLGDPDRRATNNYPGGAPMWLYLDARVVVMESDAAFLKWKESKVVRKAPVAPPPQTPPQEIPQRRSVARIVECQYSMLYNARHGLVITLKAGEEVIRDVLVFSQDEGFHTKECATSAGIASALPPIIRQDTVTSFGAQLQGKRVGVALVDCEAHGAHVRSYFAPFTVVGGSG